jgi:ATP-binding cassette subfamily B protein
VGATLRIVWEAAPLWATLWALLLAVQGAVPAALVALTKWLVDAVAAAVGSGASAEAVGLVLLPAALMGGLFLLQRILGGLSEWVGVAQSEYVSDHVSALVHDKSSEVDFAFYESPDYHDLLDQVSSQASSRTLQLVTNVGAMGRTVVTLLSIGAILAAYGAWIPLALIASAAPALVIVLRHNREYHAWWQASTARRRLAQYFGLMLTQDAAAAEVRMNRLGRRFADRYLTIRHKLRSERLDLIRRQAVGRVVAAALSLLVTAAVMGWVVWEALHGRATLGDLAAFYQAFTQAQNVAGTLLQSAGSVYTNSLFIRHLFEFLQIEPVVRDPEDPVPFPDEIREGVRFEDVVFSYPGTEHRALDGFDLTIPAGKTVAVVGENGAGKSTFIKLLCRFYDPDRGRVTVDGVDLRRFAQEDLRRHVAVLFQFAMHYHMTARENVRIGDVDAADEAGRLEAAVRSAGAEDLFARLPRGYDTLLGRWFEGGTELSGGEWQRVALARAVFRQAPLIVLDEPTSAMDSWAEAVWLERFREMARGRTALIITHRFTTAMQADVIHVVDGGRVVESGTHAELVARGGRYATSWAAQVRQSAHEPAGDGAVGPLADGAESGRGR